MNASSPEVALAVTTTAKSTDPAIDLLATLSTVTTEASASVLFFPSTPARENDAPPLAFKTTTMVPLAEPPNVTTSFASETVNVADWTSPTPPIVVASPTALALLAADAAATSVSTPDIAVGFAVFAASITAFTASAFVKSTDKELSDAVLTVCDNAFVTSRPAAPPPAAAISPATCTPALYTSRFSEAMGSVLRRSASPVIPRACLTEAVAEATVSPASTSCCTRVVSGVTTVDPAGAKRMPVNASVGLSRSRARPSLPSTTIDLVSSPPRANDPSLPVRELASPESNMPLPFSSRKMNPSAI